MQNRDEKQKAGYYRRVVTTEAGQGDVYEIKKLINYTRLHKGQLLSRDELDALILEGITIVIE